MLLKPRKPPLKSALIRSPAATQTYRAEYVARMEELFMTKLVELRSQLAFVEMDINKIAPYPDSFRTGRKEYRSMLAKHKRVMSYFATDESDPRSRQQFSLVMYGKAPWKVVEKPGAEPSCRAEGRRAANADFDSFLYKLAFKISRSISSASMVGTLWENCTLSVLTEDDEKQVWTTHCIINRSVYDKLFNQWPTRRII